MSTYCPYCLHRMDQDELTESGLRQELAHRLYPDASEFENDIPGYCRECRRPILKGKSGRTDNSRNCQACGQPLPETEKMETDRRVVRGPE